MDILQRLDRPPTPKYSTHLQADFVELRCLVHPDRSIGKSEVHDLFAEDADINRENPYYELPNDAAMKTDKQLEYIDDWFQYLEYRAEAFDSAYPFQLRSNSNLLEVKRDLNDHNRLYVYLLMASSLRYYGKPEEKIITSSFESISAEALKQYIGDKAEIHVFGANSSSRYTGDIDSKIEELAKDICEVARISKNNKRKKRSGDAGLDIVGWIPMDDTNPGRLLIFGQCACGKKWEDKQSSSSYQRWSRLIDLSLEPVNTIFTPYCFRDASGNWFEPQDIHMSLMIDRLRIMKLLSTVKSPLSELPSEIRHLIDRTLSFVEEL